MTIQLVLSQEKVSTENNFYINFDKSVNLLNTNISHGISFKEKFRKIKGNHNYYLSNDFFNGEINYRGENFPNINFKYDLVDDNLIVQIPHKQHKLHIILEKKLVSNFQLNNVTFYNIKSMGFAEKIVIEKKVSLFKKHLKKPIKKLNQNFTHFEFSKSEKYILGYQGEYQYVKSKKEFIKLFPFLKKKVTAFFREKNTLKKINPDTFYTQLIQLINKELSNQ